MANECDYSFTDLFRAAFKRGPSIDEIAHFHSLPQADKNEAVKLWASKAEWEVKDVIGEDGQAYTSFAPTFTEGENPNDLSKYGIKKVDE